MSTPPAPDIGHLTHPGRKREANEDNYGLPPPDLNAETLAAKGRLYVVADGVGGHKGGQVASRLAVQVTVQEYYRDPSPDWRVSLTQAIRQANTQVVQTGQRTPGAQRMATTITAAVVRGGELLVANVGDSRVYLLRGGSMQQLTQDHTLVAEALANGTITPEQALTHPFRGRITRAIGKGPDVKVDLNYHRLQPGDRLLLCSDGLNNEVADGEIAATIRGARSAQEASNRLVDQANQRGGRDNITALVVSLSGGRPAAVAAVPPWLLMAAGGALSLVLVAVVLAVLFRNGGTSTPTPMVIVSEPSATVMSPTLPSITTVETVVAETPNAAKRTEMAKETDERATESTKVTPTPAVSTSPGSPTLELTSTTATPVATDTPETPTADASEDLPVNTPTPAPSDTNTPAPTNTRRPRNTPTPPLYILPRLSDPPDGFKFSESTIELKWGWAGELKADEVFDVRVWREGKAHWGVARTKGTSLTLSLPHADQRLNEPNQNGIYYWAVAVIQEAPGSTPDWVRKSDESAYLSFVWEGGSEDPCANCSCGECGPRKANPPCCEECCP